MANSSVFYTFIELSDEGSPDIDILAAGSFIDAYQRQVKFDEADLATYIANTKRVIASTVDSQGNPIGLPIDAKGHDKGDGAGWLLDVYLGANGRIKARTAWTSIGRDLIGGNIRRFFSATVDTAKKVIRGGTLTNWPATRGPGGELLLAPVELSEDRLLKSVQDPVKLPAWLVEYQSSQIGDQDMAQKDEDRKPVDLSTLTLDQLPKNLLADLHSQWEASQNGADGDGMSEVVDLEAARTAMAAEMEAQLKAEYTRMQEASAKMLKGLIAEMRHEGQIIELAQDLTTPSEQSPHTLPVTGEAMQTFLKSLTQPQLDQARAIFGAIQRDGLVEFEAIGHGKTKTGTIQLESHVKSLLRSHLADGGDMDEFFEVAGIGDRKDFDLSEFTEEK